MPIEFVDLKSQYSRIKVEIDSAIQQVLDDGRYVLGPALTEFEDAAAQFVGAKYCVGVSSGTDALVLPLMAAGIGSGDAVFVPSFTYTASAEVILLVGATPVFVDVDRATMNISPASLVAAIDRVRDAGDLNPRAVIAVDLFGLPADYERLGSISDEAGILLLSDAAQSFGGQAGNRRVGTLAPVTATSFYPAKPLGCYGDGGAIFTDDESLKDVLVSLRTHGTGSHKYDVLRVGMNARLDTIQAAILSQKLAIFEDEMSKREHVAEAYDAALADVVEIPPRSPHLQSAWAQYTIKTDDRDDLQSYLGEQGVPTVVYYPKPMHMQTAYKRYAGEPRTLEVSTRLCDEVLSIPMHPYLSPEHIDHITSSISRFFRQ